MMFLLIEHDCVSTSCSARKGEEALYGGPYLYARVIFQSHLSEYPFRWSRWMDFIEVGTSPDLSPRVIVFSRVATYLRHVDG